MSFKLSLPALLLSLPFFACASAEERTPETGLVATSSESADTAADADAGTPETAPKTFLEITANGTGCRPGTWTAQLAPDGASFSVSFSDFTAKLDVGSALAVADCQLGVVVHAPEGLQFSVTEVNLHANESLSDGVTLRQSVKHYFQGSPLAAVAHERAVTGPGRANGGTYWLRDQIDEAEGIWSPCGGGRTLDVETRLLLKNNADKTGSGSAQVAGGWMKRSFALRWRACAG